jgi:dienelactone hydrolase
VAPSTRLAVGALAAASLAGCGASASSQSESQSSASKPGVITPPSQRSEPDYKRNRGPFAVGVTTITFVDRSRSIALPGRPRRVLRALRTIIRYPAALAGQRTDVGDAPPARNKGPFPLVVFGHGYNITPGPYAPLLQAWARAGYVVAAPVFPLENANAPGGPNENDLVNQPEDMKVIIGAMLDLGTGGRSRLSGLIDPRHVAVAGQSDGGETALAVAYDKLFHDRRVGAAVILSGAKIPGMRGFTFPAPSPPLMATQGTADTINLPHYTHEFFDGAPPPKYLLTMFGASHLGPYTTTGPQARTVQKVTVLFLDRYLKGIRDATLRLIKAGDVGGRSVVNASP